MRTKKKRKEKEKHQNEKKSYSLTLVCHCHVPSFNIRVLIKKCDFASSFFLRLKIFILIKLSYLCCRNFRKLASTRIRVVITLHNFAKWTGTFCKQKKSKIKRNRYSLRRIIRLDRFVASAADSNNSAKRENKKNSQKHKTILLYHHLYDCAKHNIRRSMRTHSKENNIHIQYTYTCSL